MPYDFHLWNSSTHNTSMAQRTHLRADIHSRETRRATWRFLLRHLHFRMDLNRFHHELHPDGTTSREIAEKLVFSSSIFSAETPDLSSESIPTYEALFALDGNSGDPEEVWRLIRPKNVAGLPPIDLGNRWRLDKVDFYCKGYDLHVKVDSLGVFLFNTHTLPPTLFPFVFTHRER